MSHNQCLCDRGAYCPSPSVIARRMATFQRQWTEEERQQRLVATSIPSHPRILEQMVHLSDLVLEDDA